MANFDQSRLALKSVCPNNELLYDDKEMPSVMVWVPSIRICDVLSSEDTSVLPAFRRDGKEIPGFWVGKFQSIHAGGRAYSLPGEDPANTASLDTFVANARAKGEGWHEVSAAEWAAIALWCHKNGCEPKGNNNYGKDTTETLYHAIPTSIDTSAGGKTGRVATGTGPITWSHDGTLEGIWDLNGNVWEWVTGLRLVYGEVQIIKDNDASSNTCDLSESSSAWKAINASDGTLVTPDGSGTTEGTVKLDYVDSKWKYVTTITSSADEGRSCPFKDMVCDAGIGDAAKLLLQSLALLPDTELAGEGIDATYGGDIFWGNNAAAERCAIRGGDWSNSTGAGVFRMGLNHTQSSLSATFGGRSAFAEPEE